MFQYMLRGLKIKHAKWCNVGNVSVHFEGGTRLSMQDDAMWEMIQYMLKGHMTKHARWCNVGNDSVNVEEGTRLSMQDAAM